MKLIDRNSYEEIAIEQEEKEMLWQELNVRDKLSKKEALTLLRGKGADKKFDLNYDELSGNFTRACFVRMFQEILVMSGHDVDFKKMNAQEIEITLKTLFRALGWNIDVLNFDSSLPEDLLEKQDSYRLWHLLYSYDDSMSKNGIEGLKKKIARLCNFDEEYASVLAKVAFPLDYGNLSARAMRKILPYLRAGNVYSRACELAGYRHSKRSLSSDEIAERPLVDRLETLQRNSLRNPVVEKILNQMINVVNAVMERYGRPDEIRVEMARELKNSAKKRESISVNNKNANAKNEKIKQILQTEFGIANPSKNDIVRYRLYEELESRGFRTLYSDVEIRRQELFSKKYDIEHIIPQALLFDDSYSNKTLELRDVNIAKGSFTALDFVSMRYDAEQYKARVLELFRSGAISLSKKNKLLMRRQDIPSDFLNRDLVNTQYIARKAVEILESVTRSVVCTNGAITAALREDWQIVDVIKELNWDKYDKLGLTEVVENRDGQKIRKIEGWNKRDDHRHHAMDAITIAFTSRGIIKYLNDLSSMGTDKYATRLRYQFRDEHDKWRFVPPVVPVAAFRAEVKSALQNILISIKSKNKVMTRNVNKVKVKGGFKKKVQLTPRGQLHKESVYGRIKQYVTQEETVGRAFDETKIMTVADARYRTALLDRLKEYGNDPGKAFTGKNSLEKNPIYIDSERLLKVPSKVKTVTLDTQYVIRKEVSKDLKIDKVIDRGVRRKLQERLEECGGNAATAFSNLEENPIYMNREKGITIKRVRIGESISGFAIHSKLDRNGNVVEDGLPVDYVELRNNHHSAVYCDENGDLQVKTVTFLEVVERVRQGMPIIDKDYRMDEGWRFLYSMKINEYFVFPNAQTGFDPNEIDLTDPANYAAISPNLYRVQKLSDRDYRFRHHLETSVDENKLLNGYAFKRITSNKNLKGIVKVRINHLGEIVTVGEY